MKAHCQRLNYCLLVRDLKKEMKWLFLKKSTMHLKIIKTLNWLNLKRKVLNNGISWT